MLENKMSASSYNQATFMILYSQTNQKLLIDHHYNVSGFQFPVTMVTHGASGEGGTRNEAVYRHTPKCRL